MLQMGEHEGYHYSIFGQEAGMEKLAISVQDHNGKDILDEDTQEMRFDTVGHAEIEAVLSIEAYIEGNLARGHIFYSYRNAVRDFKELNEPFIVARYGPDDVTALREAFNNWTDMLCKDGLIDDTQYNQWDNPY